MKNRYMLALSLLAVSLIGGCAPLLRFPPTANVVTLEDDRGNVGMSCYRESAVFQNVNTKRIVDATKAGLEKAGFVPTLVNEADGVVFGKHGMTFRHVNLIAGVDIQEVGNDATVVVVVRGTKKPGVSDEPEDGVWPDKILQGMRDYLEPAIN